MREYSLFFYTVVSHLDERLVCKLIFVDEHLPVIPWSLNNLSSCPTVDLHSLYPEFTSHLDITVLSFPGVDPHDYPFDSASNDYSVGKSFTSAPRMWKRPHRIRRLLDREM